MRISNSSITIFSGNHTKEVLRISEQWETLPVGAIMRSLCEIDSSTYDMLFNIATRLGKLVYSAKYELYNHLEYMPYAYYERYISTLSEIDELNIPAIMQKLFKFLPMQYNLINSDQIYVYCERYKHDFDSFPYVFQPYHPERYEILYQYKKPLDAFIPPTCDEYHHSLHWAYFLSDLVRSHIDSKRELINVILRDALRVLELYARSLYSLINEATLLKRVIKDNLTANRTIEEIRLSLMGSIPEVYYYSPAPFDTYIANYIKNTCPLKNPIDLFYTATSLTRLIMLELDLAESRGLFVRRCACCQKLYITYNAQSKYCHFPNADLDGKTCHDMASRLQHLANKPLSVQRNKNRDRYKKWVEPIVTESRDYIKELKRNILTSAVYATSIKERKAYFRSIIQEVATLFEKWDADSQAAIREFKNGKITKAECEARIAYPPERDRGPMLYDILDRKRDAP